MSNSLIGNLLVASTLVDDPVLSRAVCLLVHHDEKGVVGVMLNRPLQPNPNMMMQMLGSNQANPPTAHHPTAHHRSNATTHHRIPDLNRPPEPTQHDLSQEDWDEGEFDGNYLFDEEEFSDEQWQEETGLSDPANKPDSSAAETPAETLANASQALGTVHFGGPLSGPVVAIHASSEFAEAEAGRGIYMAAQKPNLEALVCQNHDPYRLIVGHLGWEPHQLQEEFDAGYWHMIPATTDAVFAQDQDMWAKLIRRATANSVAGWIGTPDVPMAYDVN